MKVNSRIQGDRFAHFEPSNCTVLLGAGLRDVEVFFKWCNFVGMVAVK